MTMPSHQADVSCEPSETLRLIAHPLYDPTNFASLTDLFDISRREGYQGGMRLLMATCKKFFEYCVTRGIALPKRNFTLKCDAEQDSFISMSLTATSRFSATPSVRSKRRRFAPKGDQREALLTRRVCDTRYGQV